MAKHHIADHTGHTTIEFDPLNTVQLDEAMARFKALTAGRGGVAAVRKAGETEYTAVKAFDPTADETLFLPHDVGG